MIKLYHGDCLEVMKDIPDESVDMILADLPYGTTKVKWDVVIPFDKLWEQYNRILKPKGIVALTATEPFTSVVVQSNLELFKEKLVWIKSRPSNFANAKYRHMKYTEDIVVFGEAGSTYNRQMVPRTSTRIAQAQSVGGKLGPTSTSEVSYGSEAKLVDAKKYDANWKNPTDYIKVPGVQGNSREKTPHPTQKPVKLLEYLIKTYSNEGETVLDNTMGSGSTGVASKNTGRSFIGIELDDEYFDIAKERIESHEQQLELV